MIGFCLFLILLWFDVLLFHGILGRIFGFPGISVRITEMRQLFDVMHQTGELPLSVHLFPPTQRETVQALVVAQVAKYRLDGCEARGDHLPAEFRIDAPLHPIRVGLPPLPLAHEVGHLTGLRGLRLAQAVGAQLTGLAIPHRALKLDGGKAVQGAIRTIAIQPLAGWADAVGVVIGQPEIVGPETLDRLLRFALCSGFGRLDSYRGGIG